MFTLVCFIEFHITELQLCLLFKYLNFQYLLSILSCHILPQELFHHLSLLPYISSFLYLFPLSCIPFFALSSLLFTFSYSALHPPIFISSNLHSPPFIYILHAVSLFIPPFPSFFLSLDTYFPSVLRRQSRCQRCHTPSRHSSSWRTRRKGSRRFCTAPRPSTGYSTRASCDTNWVRWNNRTGG